MTSKVNANASISHAASGISMTASASTTASISDFKIYSFTLPDTATPLDLPVGFVPRTVLIQSLAEDVAVNVLVGFSSTAFPILLKKNDFVVLTLAADAPLLYLKTSATTALVKVLAIPL